MLRFVSKFQGPDQDQDQNRDRYLTCRSSLLKRKKRSETQTHLQTQFMVKIDARNFELSS